MYILEADFQKIVKYIKEHLLSQVETIDNIKIVRQSDIMIISETITLNKFLKEIGEKKERKKPGVNYEETGDFLEWWNTYPTNANFEYKGVQFRSTRALRSNKDVCKMLYNKTLGQYPSLSPQDILKALQTQIEMMKEESYETGKNKLTFLPASETYLRQERWEAFLNVDNGSLNYDDNSNCG